MIKIIVITTCLNEESSIEQHLAVLRMYQKNDSIKAIVIDGGSTDSTLNILQSYRDIQSFHLKKASIYNAFNFVISKFIKDDVFFSFLGVGDFINKSFYDLALKRFDMDIIYPNLKDKNSGKITYSVDPITENYSWGKLPFPHIATLFKSSLFRKYGLFNAKYKIAADLEWILRIYFQSSFFRLSIKSIKAGNYYVIFKPGGLSTNIKYARLLKCETYAAYRNYPYKVSIKRILYMNLQILKAHILV
jgi:glycosyltransferase involved in cell wall biosynthesis